MLFVSKNFVFLAKEAILIGDPVELSVQSRRIKYSHCGIKMERCSLKIVKALTRHLTVKVDLLMPITRVSGKRIMVSFYSSYINLNTKLINKAYAMEAYEEKSTTPNDC